MKRTWFVLGGTAALISGIFWFGPSALVREKVEAPKLTWPHQSGRLVVDLVDGSTEADLQAIEAEIGADLDWVSDLTIDEALAQGDVADVEAAIEALANDPRVEVAEPEVLVALDDELISWSDDGVEASGFPNDPLYERQWHLREMGAPVGWSSTARGKGVIVAVIDTGIAPVEDLAQTEILKGASFVPWNRSAVDDQGHGTHVAGTIAQSTNNGKGTAGIAPAATLLPVKVLDKHGRGMSPWIAGGIDYAVDQGADVINLSLGGSYSAVVHNAIKKARKKGVLVIAAAGNSGREGVSYPGALEETIGVSAVGPGGGLAPYSSWGKGVDIAGPGGDKTKAGGGVWQDTIDGKGGHHYAEFQGTSMATPHVAGAAAVLLSTGMSPDRVEEVLLNSAEGAGKWDPKMGYGRLRLDSALGVAPGGGTSGAIRFGIGLVLAVLLAQLSGAKGRFLALSAAVGAWAAGGLFFLDWIPFLPSLGYFDFLKAAPLDWPSYLLGGTWSNFPLWISAAIPGAAAFVLGAFKPTRPLAMGLCSGIGAHLFHAAATGSLEPWWLPSFLGMLWLVGNGTICVILAMGMAGAEKLDNEKATTGSKA